MLLTIISVHVACFEYSSDAETTLHPLLSFVSLYDQLEVAIMLEYFRVIVPTGLRWPLRCILFKDCGVIILQHV